MLKGQIMKALSGFYYVECENQVYRCKARGKFRKMIKNHWSVIIVSFLLKMVMKVIF